MNVTEAAKVWEDAKREIDRLKPELEQAAEILKAHFRGNKKRDFRGRIGYAVSTRLSLDTAKVKAELGDRLPDFQKRVDIEQLSLLK
jgi:hypothetical protein